MLSIIAMVIAIFSKYPRFPRGFCIAPIKRIIKNKKNRSSENWISWNPLMRKPPLAAQGLRYEVPGISDPKNLNIRQHSGG